MGGWVVVVYRYIIMPLRGPTCNMVLARIQLRVEKFISFEVLVIVEL